MPHIHELYDFTSSAYIVFENKVLLVHHKKLKTWIAPGGHIELDEDPIQTLWREITEETGLKKPNLKLIKTSQNIPELENTNFFQELASPFAMFVVDYGINSAHKHIDLCYLITSNTSKVTLEASSSYGIDWFSVDNIELLHKKGLMFQNSYVYSKFAINYIKNNVLA